MSRILVPVRVTPRASREEVAGVRDGELLVRVTAPAEGGRANAAACRLVAGAFGVPKSAVSVERGGASRHKMLAVEGVAPGRAEELLGGA